MIDMNEVQSASETLAHAFEEYKSVNDMRLNELERKGSVDVIVDEKLGRMDGAINKLQNDISAVKTALRRPSMDQGKAVFTDEKEGEYKSAFMRYLTKGVEPDLMVKDISLVHPLWGRGVARPVLSRSISPVGAIKRPRPDGLPLYKARQSSLSLTVQAGLCWEGMCDEDGSE